AALFQAIRNPKMPPLARRFAADLLSTRQDLPFWFGHWSIDRLLPDDLPLIESVAAFWEEIRPLSHRDQFRKKVERALLLERDHANPKDDRGWFLEWMKEHTGHVPPKGKSDGELGEYSRWWDAHGKED